MSNGAFIERIYRSLLGREPDQSGLQGYLQALDSGDVGRAQVVGLVISSAEFQRILPQHAQVDHLS
jgi:hypothetical protein